MQKTTAGKGWIGGMLFALLLCVGGFASAVSLLLSKDCKSLEVPGSVQYGAIGDGLRYWCEHWGLWAPVSFNLFFGVIGLALLVFSWRERQRRSL
jgi:hypothetical protein